MAGRTSKDTSYRDRLIASVGNDPKHPLNQGIHMEAHHLISAEGTKLSGIGQRLLDCEYNINLLGNLVFLPATLPGACHLQVQLHRGNHYAYKFTEDKDDDESHPIEYHKLVAEMLAMALPELRKCTGKCEKKAKEAREIIDEISESILDMIDEFEIPLSPIFRHFHKDSEIGCGNCIDVKEHGGEQCGSNRDHQGEEHPKFKSGKDKRIITRNPRTKYTLKVGK